MSRRLIAKTAAETAHYQQDEYEQLLAVAVTASCAAERVE